MDETINQIKTIAGSKLIEYEKYFMKIIFESDVDLTSNNLMSISSMIILARSVFQEGNKVLSTSLLTWVLV